MTLFQLGIEGEEKKPTNNESLIVYFIVSLNHS